MPTFRDTTTLSGALKKTPTWLQGISNERRNLIRATPSPGSVCLEQGIGKPSLVCFPENLRIDMREKQWSELWRSTQTLHSPTLRWRGLDGRLTSIGPVQTLPRRERTPSNPGIPRSLDSRP